MAKSEDLILEYRQEGRLTWAIQFYRNGLVKEFSDSSMDFIEGQIVTLSKPLAWRNLAHLDSGEMKKLVEVMGKVDFFALPGKLGDAGRVKDGTRSTWTMNLEGKSKVVVAFGKEATSNEVLKTLREAIQAVTADAFKRRSSED
jgi:hypothetical protein